MLRLHASGYHSVLRADDRGIETNRVRDGLVAQLYDQGLTMDQVAAVFGLHKSSVHRIVARSKNESDVTPVFGSGEWTPDVQDQSPAACDRCGGDDGVIRKGSKLYCAACHRSGLDRKLAEQRVEVEIAERYADVAEQYEKAASRKPLAQRRKIKRA